jgi:hypothetical protein
VCSECSEKIAAHDIKDIDLATMRNTVRIAVRILDDTSQDYKYRAVRARGYLKAALEIIGYDVDGITKIKRGKGLGQGEADGDAERKK